MRYGVPLFGERVAPRCTRGDGVLIATVRGQRIVEQVRLNLSLNSVENLVDLTHESHLDALVCGGVSQQTLSVLESHVGVILPNVSGTVDEVLAWLVDHERRKRYQADSSDNSVQEGHKPSLNSPTLDCIACSHPVCLESGGCSLEGAGIPVAESFDQRMVDVARDLNYEEDSRLCRLSELVYFSLEMNYRSLGVAYCSDLFHPAAVLTRVLRRFFTVHPVCCKIHLPNTVSAGVAGESFDPAKCCNPVGQAEHLNRIGTDMNIIVGLCIGADCVFARSSHAPVTTLFNKDRALANNPIGAVYSERYLREAVESAGGSWADASRDGFTFEPPLHDSSERVRS